MIKTSKLFLSIMFLISFTAFSQDLVVNYRFLKENIPIKDYDLDINKDYSLFYETGYCLSNLVSKSELIFLKDKSFEIKLLDKVGDLSVSTSKPNQLNWEIKSEKKVIEGYNCQKAETFYRNQKWTAWFTTDLPFQDGPFVFKGLPGLILVIDNEKYKFELLEISKSTNQCSIAIDNRKEISYEKYESLFNDVSNKNNALLNSLGNLNLNLETNLSSMSEKESKLNIIRELL